MNQWWYRWRSLSNSLLYVLGLAIATFLLLVTIVQPSQSKAIFDSTSTPEFWRQHFNQKLAEQLPSPQIHPLPASLQKWQNQSDRFAPQHSRDRNYFDRVKPTSLGYLIWSELPVKIYLEPNDRSSRSRQWTEAVLQAIKEWNLYLPLQATNNLDLADIIIKRSPPPRKAKINRETGLFDLPRVRNAQTSYKFYLKADLLAHRMTVEIDPNRSRQSILGTTRHELGHALGIWGHSPLKTDALYFSAVSDPPPISTRDINTLKQIYQQPTRLGWNLPKNDENASI